jgi:hypothetical protein
MDFDIGMKIYGTLLTLVVRFNSDGLNISKLVIEKSTGASSTAL